MSASSRWGRWLLDGDYLVYRPDGGEPDPGYELHISELESVERVKEWVEHLRMKNWVSPQDISDFSKACASIMKEHLVNERNLDVPQPMSWDEYRERLEAEWNNFLSEADPTDEAVFQQFLEQHPMLLPGPYGTPYGRYHGPLFRAAFTQPELPGFRAKKPDFLLFEQDSARIYAVLIEIEAPAKPWSNKDGTPSSKLTKAIDQIRSWKAWFQEPHNLSAFQQLYNIGPDLLTSRRLVQHYVLIYGRRGEATSIASFGKKRADLNNTDEFSMTYDRLQPNGSAYFTLKLDRSGPDTKLRVISVPPTLTIEKENATWFSSLLGREEAIRNHPFISDARKAFLLERLRIAEAHAQKLGRPSSIPLL
jgi:Domain of unknown function (DUF4263)